MFSGTAKAESYYTQSFSSSGVFYYGQVGYDPAGNWSTFLPTSSQNEGDIVGYQTDVTEDYQINSIEFALWSTYVDGTGNATSSTSKTVILTISKNDGVSWSYWQSTSTVPLVTVTTSSPATVSQTTLFDEWQPISTTDDRPTLQEGDTYNIRIEYYAPESGLALYGIQGNLPEPLRGSVEYNQLFRYNSAPDTAIAAHSASTWLVAGINYEVDSIYYDADGWDSGIPTSTYDGTFSEYLPDVYFTSGTIAMYSNADGLENKIFDYTGVEQRLPICLVTPFVRMIDTFRSWTLIEQDSVQLKISGGIVPNEVTIDPESFTDDTLASIGAKEPIETVFRFFILLGWFGLAAYVVIRLMNIKGDYE